MAQRQDFLKYVLIGNEGTGKSSVQKRYVYDTFQEELDSTLGVDFGIRTIGINEQSYTLQIWDTGGQERFRALTNSYYREAKAIFVFYNTTLRASFEAIDQYVADVREHNPENCEIVLVGTHADAMIGMVPFSDAQQKARNLGLDETMCFEVSAKTGEGIDKMFEAVSSKVVAAKPAPRPIRFVYRDEAGQVLGLDEYEPNRFFAFLARHKWAILTAALVTAAIVAASIVFWPAIVASVPVVAAASAISVITMKVGLFVSATAFAATAISMVGALCVSALSWLVDVLTKPRLITRLTIPNRQPEEVPVLNLSSGTHAELNSVFNQDNLSPRQINAAVVTSAQQGQDRFSKPTAEQAQLLNRSPRFFGTLGLTEVPENPDALLDQDNNTTNYYIV